MARKSNSADDSAPIPGERRGHTGFEPFANTTEEVALSVPLPQPNDGGEATTHNEALEPMPGGATTRGDGRAVRRDPPDSDSQPILEPVQIIESTSHSALPPVVGGALDFDATSHESPPDDGMSPIIGEPTPADTPAAREALGAFADPPGDSPEHTTIDGDLLSKIAALPPREKSPRAERESGRGSRPKRRGTDVDQALAAAAIEAITTGAESQPFEESKSASVSKGDGPGSTVILNGEGRRGRDLESSAVGRLGPAFPENEDDPPSSEMPTSARPSVAPPYSGDGPRSAMKTRAGGGGPGLAQGPGSGSITGDVPTADDDGWSDFQEASDEWGRSDSVSAVKPSSRRSVSAQKPTKRKRDTGVYGPQEREHPEPVVRLIVISAEDKGPIEIHGEDVTLGREADNQVVLKDPSISRKHARLTRVEDGWDLIDLHSGNGTYVNGKRIERALVKNNDEIRLGSATFRFADTSDGMRPVDASAAPVLAGSNRVAFFARLRENPRLRTVVYGSAILTCVLLATLVVMFSNRGASKTHAEVFEYYLQGVEAFKQRHWVSAEGFFAAALQHDRDHQRSRRYLEAIAVEKRAEQALLAAKERLNAQDLSGAYENALQGSDSLFFGIEAQKLIGIVARDADERINRARAALVNDDKTTAKALLDGLEFYSAYRSDLNELRRQAGLPPIAGRSVNILQQYDTPTPRDERKRREGPDHKPTETRPRSATSEATDILAEGRIDEAISKLRALGDNKEAVELIERIGKFGSLYDEGLQELRLKRQENAIRQLTQALQLLERMTGQGRGELSKKVRADLADGLYLRAVAQYQAGSLEDAEKTLKLATNYSERHQQSVNLLTKIQTER